MSCWQSEQQGLCNSLALGQGTTYVRCLLAWFTGNVCLDYEAKLKRVQMCYLLDPQSPVGDLAVASCNNGFPPIVGV